MIFVALPPSRRSAREGEAKAQQEWEADKADAIRLLQAESEACKKFIADNLELTSTDLGFGELVTSVDKVQSIAVMSAQTLSTHGRTDGEVFCVSFDINVELSITVERHQYSTAPTFKVGQARDVTERMFSYLSPSMPQWESRSKTIRLTIEATAVFKGGRYENLRFVSLKKPSAFEALGLSKILGVS